jgi:hypothetical protein
LVQIGVVLQNPKMHMFLHMFQSPDFACLPFEFETELEVGPLSKVVVLDVVLDEVQRGDKV